MISSLSHTDNPRNDFLILSMEALVHQKKKLILLIVKQRQSFVWVHYNAGNSDLFVNGKEICKCKASNKNNSFPS